MKYPKPSLDRTSRSLGFTLLEVMLVVVVVGAMAALGVTNYRKTVDRTRYQNVAKSLESMFRKARDRAVGDGVEVWMGATWVWQNTPPYGWKIIVWAARGNTNGDGGVDWWWDANYNGKPDPGEYDVTEYIAHAELPYTQFNIYGWDSGDYFGLRAGCRLASDTSAWSGYCGRWGSVVIKPNGFVYGRDGYSDTANYVLASYGYTVYDWQRWQEYPNNMGIVMITPSGQIKGVYWE